MVKALVETTKISHSKNYSFPFLVAHIAKAIINVVTQSDFSQLRPAKSLIEQRQSSFYRTKAPKIARSEGNQNAIQ